VVEPSAELFAAGVAFYAGRPDKDWPLTDCISFVVMEREGIREALTGDRYFEQAGFVALLKLNGEEIRAAPAHAGGRR